MHSPSVCRSLLFNFSDVSSIISEVMSGKLSNVRASKLHHAGLFAVSKAFYYVTVHLFCDCVDNAISLSGAGRLMPTWM